MEANRLTIVSGAKGRTFTLCFAWIIQSMAERPQSVNIQTSFQSKFRISAVKL